MSAASREPDGESAKLEDPDDGDDAAAVAEEADEGAFGAIGAEGSQVGRKSLTGQTCSLKTLVDDDVLQPGPALLQMQLADRLFTADLLQNGSIRWTETKQIFSTPSSWVNYCRRATDPTSTAKAASAWSTIRYKGKRLDSYKLRWYRRQKKIISNAHLLEKNHHAADGSVSLSSDRSHSDKQLKSQNIVEHATLPLRGQQLPDPSVMIRCTPFSAIERIQPFTVNLSTNALLLIDFHCHLTSGEVTGYLSGSWDFATHCLTITQAFPCRSRLGDKKRSSLVEEEIRTNMEQRHLTLVGWYHSHPRAAPQPTIADIENQLEYQIAMKGENDTSYKPCVALISSPYDPSNTGLESNCQLFWTMPAPDYRPYEYGRPMLMNYSVTRDSYLTQDLLLEMRLLAHFYMDGADAMQFTAELGKGRSGSYWDKLQVSLKPNLPRDLQAAEGQSAAQVQVQQQALAHFWAFVKGLLVPSE